MIIKIAKYNPDSTFSIFNLKGISCLIHLKTTFQKIPKVYRINSRVNTLIINLLTT